MPYLSANPVVMKYYFGLDVSLLLLSGVDEFPSKRGAVTEVVRASSPREHPSFVPVLALS